MILWIFEVGYFLQHTAVLFQIQSIMKKQSTEAIAIETIYFFLIGSICRLIWMWDSMLANFYLAYIELIIGFASIFFIIKYYNEYKQRDYIRADTKIPRYLQFDALLGVILILSFFFHPGNKNKYYLTLQMFVSLNIFSECIGLLPQLYLIKTNRDAGNISEYYIIFLGVARFFRLLFWFKMYIDGNSFISLILADFLHTLLLGYFIYTYRSSNSTFFIPTYSSDDVSKERKKIF